MIEIDGIKGFVFPDGTVQSTAVSAVNLGNSQYWSVKTTAERPMNTWIENTTGRPIMLVIGRNGADGATNTLYIQNGNGTPSAIAASSAIGNYGGLHSNLTGIVPAGHWFRLEGSAYSFWSELTS